MEFWHSKSYFDILIEGEYRILTFKILFWNSNWALIIFWHSNWGWISNFYIQTEAQNHILTLKILYWHSNWAWILHFDIQNPILKFELRMKVKVDIQPQFECQNRILNVKIWYSVPIQMSKIEKRKTKKKKRKVKNKSTSPCLSKDHPLILVSCVFMFL